MLKSTKDYVEPFAEAKIIPEKNNAPADFK